MSDCAFSSQGVCSFAHIRLRRIYRLCPPESDIQPREFLSSSGLPCLEAACTQRWFAPPEAQATLWGRRLFIGSHTMPRARLPHRRGEASNQLASSHTNVKGIQMYSTLSSLLLQQFC